MSTLDNAVKTINESAERTDKTTKFVDDWSTLDDTSLVTNPNNNVTIPSAQKKIKDLVTEFGIDTDAAEAAATAAEQSAQDAAAIVPALQSQIDDRTTYPDLVTVREDLLGPGTKLYMGADGASVKVGDIVPAGTTHLRVEIDGSPTLVAMSPVASGSVTALSDTSATVGGVTVSLSGGVIYHAASVSDMVARSANLAAGQVRSVPGRYFAGDGGAAEYVIESGTPNGMFLIDVGSGLVARLNTNVPTNKQLGLDETDANTLLLLSENFDGYIVIDGSVRFNAVLTYSRSFWIKGINSVLNTSSTPPNGTFYVNTDHYFFIDGFELGAGAGIQRILKSTYSGENVSTTQGKSLGFAGGGFSASKWQTGQGEGKFSKSLMDIHNYTDTPSYRCDNVGSSPMFFGVAARNPFRRWDKPTDYIGDGDFLDLPITRSDNSNIEQLWTVSANGEQTFFNAETQVGNTKRFKQGVQNISRVFIENASNIMVNVMTWWRNSDGVNTIATQGEDWTIGTFSDNWTIKGNSVAFQCNNFSIPPINVVIDEIESSSAVNSSLFVNPSNGNLQFKDRNGVVTVIVTGS